MMKSFVFAICLFGLFITTGCGRVSPPKAPDNSFYPHTYFVQDKTVTKKQMPEPIDDELKDTGLVIEDTY